MPNLFDPSDRKSILDRLSRLQPASTRQWGKMDPAQMLAHCTVAFEAVTGDKPRKQMLIGKILSGFVKKGAFGEKPLTRNSPTDPTFVVSDSRDFSAEKKRLDALVERFCQRGPVEAAKATHSFFGRLTGDEWGTLMYKHLDHHLRQFGA